MRKIHLERLIGVAIAALEQAGLPVRALDIAAGHGRYILEALAPCKDRVEQILLRDYSLINVEAGCRLISRKGLQAIARFEQGDAFERRALAGLTPRPTLAVVSGLYELFPDNAMVAASLAGLADAMDAGTYLIYTNQPWHPQLELIARTLTSHRHGQPWIMRRRTQALDAALFGLLAGAPERGAPFDAALAMCVGGRNGSSARTLARRWSGARRLLFRQGAAVGIQAGCLIAAPMLN